MEINLGKVKGVTRDKWLDQGGSVNVQVESGDTLGAIAKKHGVSVQVLVRHNKIQNPDKLKISQTIKIPNKSPSNSSGIPDKDIETAATQSPVEDKKIVVKSGDSLSKIAKANNTTVEALASMNNIEDVNKISIGQELILTGVA